MTRSPLDEVKYVLTFRERSGDLKDEMAQLARTKLVSHGLAPSSHYGISSSIKVHSGATTVRESSLSPIKLMWTYKDLNDSSEGKTHMKG